MRTIPPELVRRYEAEGWWTRDTLGDLLARGLEARGGENISAAEVEEVLLAMPGVAEAAVVAAPDARLGEHAAAVLRLLPGHAAPTMAELRAQFERSGLAQQKWPEELHALADFPRTPSGKVQKYLLRREIAGRPAGE